MLGRFESLEEFHIACIRSQTKRFSIMTDQVPEDGRLPLLNQNSVRASDAVHIKTFQLMNVGAHDVLHEFRGVLIKPDARDDSRRDPGRARDIDLPVTDQGLPLHFGISQHFERCFVRHIKPGTEHRMIDMVVDGTRQ